MQFEYPIQSEQSRFSISPGLTRLGLRVNVVLRFLTARRHRTGVRRARRSGDRRARSAMAPGGAALRQGRLLSHPRRHRSSALSVRAGDSLPPHPLSHRRRHVLHDRSLGHVDRVGVRSRAKLAVVPATGRAVDRGLDRVHGVREHPRGGPSAGGRPDDEPASAGAALGGRVRVRADSRLRLLVRAARDAASSRDRIC